MKLKAIEEPSLLEEILTMEKSLFQKIVTRVDKVWYDITHPVFAKKYANRFSADFTQEDLEYCIPHLYKLRAGK